VTENSNTPGATVIAVVHVSGVVAFEILDSALTIETFKRFISRKLVPQAAARFGRAAHMTLVMDNLQIHKNQEALDLLGPSIVPGFIPPYSPQMNAIEQVFSHWKSKVRHELIRENRAALGEQLLPHELLDSESDDSTYKEDDESEVTREDEEEDEGSDESERGDGVLVREDAAAALQAEAAEMHGHGRGAAAARFRGRGRARGRGRDRGRGIGRHLSSASPHVVSKVAAKRAKLKAIVTSVIQQDKEADFSAYEKDMKEWCRRAIRREPF
jgi:transposase